MRSPVRFPFALVASLALIGLLVVGPRPAFAGPSTGASLRSKLLTLADLPADWSVNNSSVSGQLTSGSCLAGLLRHHAPGASRATIYFEQPGGTPALGETIGTGAGQRARWLVVDKNLGSCHSFSEDIDGTRVNTTVDRMPYPKVGQWTDAFKLTFTADGSAIGADLVLFRVNRYVCAILFSDLGTPAPQQLQDFVTEAVAKIRGGRLASA